MFESLTDRFNSVFRGIRGVGKISESNVADMMREIRTALLEADVNLEVARAFCDEVQAKAIGAEVIQTLKPDQLMVKLVHDELVALMGPVDPRIPFVTPGPTVLLMAGLQGSGKTTTCGKLAAHVIAKAKRPLMVAADLKRPAAIDQLEILGGQLDDFGALRGLRIHKVRPEYQGFRVPRVRSGVGMPTYRGRKPKAAIGGADLKKVSASVGFHVRPCRVGSFENDYWRAHIIKSSRW